MSKKIQVSREHRTHPMSKTTGGVTVTVEFKDPDKASLEYTDVKRPKKYMSAILARDQRNEIRYVYINEKDRFLVLADMKNKKYVKALSPRPNHIYEASGFKVMSRHATSEDRDKAWDDLMDRIEKRNTEQNKK